MILNSCFFTFTHVCLSLQEASDGTGHGVIPSPRPRMPPDPPDPPDMTDTSPATTDMDSGAAAQAALIQYVLLAVSSAPEEELQPFHLLSFSNRDVLGV